tara:strand:+ start:484 stop:1626 length:1143 start_codon:yes stop_codon:yes gene_type:complete
MKIAFVPSTFLPWIGGSETQIHNMANKIIELGNTVDIFLLKKEKISNGKYKIIKLNSIFINFIFILKYYLSIDLTFLLKIYFKKICKKKKYDVWHFQSVNYKTLLYLKPLKMLGEKIYITFHGADIQKDESIHYGYRFDKKYELFLSDSLKYVDKAFVISKDIERELKTFSFPSEKIVNIPCAIELKKIKNIKVNKINDEKLKIITAARYYEKKKGLDFIEKIAKQLKEKKYKFKWTLVGRNSNQLLNSSFIRNNLEYFNILDEIKNFDETYFPHSDLFKLYKNHDVYVNLARVESFGVTMIEAIACGLPVISFNTKGANELILNNENGYLIMNYNAEEMANFLMKKYESIFKNKSINSSTVEKFDLELNSRKTLNNYRN